MAARITALLLLLALCHAASAQIKATRIDLAEGPASQEGAKYFSRAEGLYIMTSEGLWLCRDGKAQPVTTADGTSFKPQGIELSATCVGDALIAPGAGEMMESTAWVVRDGVAQPLKTKAGAQVSYQRTEDTFGENNPCLKAYSNNKWVLYRIDGTTAIDVGLPTTAPGGLIFSLGGVPLFRSRRDNAEIWLLKKDKWERLNDSAGQPFNLQLGTPMTAPQGNTVPTLDHVALADQSSNVFSFKLLHVKDTTAKLVETTGLITRVSRVGKKTVIVMRNADGKTSALYEVSGTKVSPLKGAPSGDASIGGSGDVVLAWSTGKSGDSTYYRLDEKGKKEIKPPKGVTQFSLAFDGCSGKSLFAGIKYERDGASVRGFARIDEKGALSEIWNEAGSLISGTLTLLPGPAGLHLLVDGKLYFVAA